MWFLRGRPSYIKVRAFIASIANGYQQNNYRFCVQAEASTTKEGKIWVALAIPWSPHKPNGSFKIVESDALSPLLGDSSEEVTVLKETDLEICERLRSLKTRPNIELVHVQELIQWYLDDVGVLAFWAQAGKTYQLNYTHKIAADSRLFFPTRLPTIIAARKPEMDYKLWVDGGITTGLQSHLRCVDRSGVECFTFSEGWGWDDDTRIGTENWASSDDDLESSTDSE